MEKEKIFEKELFDELEHEESELEHEILNLEHDGGFSGKEELFAFAKAMKKAPEEIEEALKKGSEFDEVFKKLEAAQEDSKIFEKLAEIRGISKEEMRSEILWALEKATFEKLCGEIMEENPGMNRKTAEELANFRLEVKKSGKKPEIKDKTAEMLLELEKFIGAHSGVEKLENKIIEEWEGGIPLETAFEKQRLLGENKSLFEELEKLKNEKEKEARRNYAKEHSPGSATSIYGNVAFDEFVEGLFKEY